MEYYGRRIHLLEEILTNYTGAEPFHHYLKQFFRKHRECGSKDRKALRELAYAYWRAGVLASGNNLEEKMKSGIQILEEFNRAGVDSSALLDSTQHDTFHDQLSPFVKREQWFVSRFKEPLLWLRARRKAGVLRNYLIQAKIKFEERNDGIFGIANGVDLDTIEPKLRRTIEVQDIASQIASGKIECKDGQTIWDCCAGSGGKSLALLDRGVKLNLFLSDKRDTIMENLHSRFKNAGYKNYAHKTLDILKAKPDFFQKGEEQIPVTESFFDEIICDVPCSGSGTWGRTPEIWSFFKTSEIDRFAKWQRSLLDQAWPYLKPGGSIWYLTCSVFRLENEDVVARFCGKHPDAKIVFQEYVNELATGGDCLYIARIQKTSMPEVTES